MFRTFKSLLKNERTIFQHLPFLYEKNQKEHFFEGGCKNIF